MTIMDIAVLLFPIPDIDFNRKPGSCICVTMRKKPTNTAIIQGCVMSIFAVDFTSVFVNSDNPEDHIANRSGMSATEANNNPWPPNTDSTIGLPKNPALEQMMAYRNTACLSFTVLQKSTLLKSTYRTCVIIATIKTVKQFIKISFDHGIRNEFTILQGSMISMIKSVNFFLFRPVIIPFFCAYIPIRIYRNKVPCI